MVLVFFEPTMDVVKVFSGAFHLQHFLSTVEQQWVGEVVGRFARGAAGFYRPRVRGGGQMRCEMLCLGRHWNAMNYSYELCRTDFDGVDVPRLPNDLGAFAKKAALTAGMSIRPDVCLINRYGPDGRMGLHQDKDECQEVIQAGIPIVSLSLGSTAIFIVGGTSRREPVKVVRLEAGDAFVMGQSSRLRYHGVSRIVPGNDCGREDSPVRYSLTFRQYVL